MNNNILLIHPVVRRERKMLDIAAFMEQIEQDNLLPVYNKTEVHDAEIKDDGGVELDVTVANGDKDVDFVFRYYQIDPDEHSEPIITIKKDGRELWESEETAMFREIGIDEAEGWQIDDLLTQFCEYVEKQV